MRSNPSAIIAGSQNSAAAWRNAARYHQGRRRLECIRRAMRVLEAARYVRQQRQREADNYDEEHFGFGWIADRERSMRQRRWGPFSIIPRAIDAQLLAEYLRHGRMAFYTKNGNS